MKQTEWFKDWFDTEYYHALYSHRDANEASDFIKKLLTLLQLPAGSKVADIACGKGRHSMVLANEGCKVAGFDLSQNSIQFANSENYENAEFFVHDIREAYPMHDCFAAFNLFTSFGYFETLSEDLKAIKNIYNLLLPSGWFVQDYINGEPILNTLPVRQTIEKCDFDFHIHKYYQSPYIVKEIEVDTSDFTKQFSEKVKVYSADELTKLHTDCGFDVQHVFGDYQLNSYDSNNSPRIIIISRK